MAWEEPPHRHTVTPIGDQVEFRSHELEIGRPTVLDRLRRGLAVFTRLAPRPKSRSGQVFYGLVAFLIIFAAAIAAAFGVGLLVEHHTTLTHNRAMITAFLIGGLGLGSPPLIIIPFGIPPRMYESPREPSEGSDNEEEAYDFVKYGVWQAHWVFWIILGTCLVATGFLVWGRGAS
jgi:hypothetical protein